MIKLYIGMYLFFWSCLVVVLKKLEIEGYGFWGIFTLVLVLVLLMKELTEYDIKNKKDEQSEE